MPNQSKIITVVNNKLKQLPDVDIQFNKGGMCAGLAGLFVKYALENNLEEFFKKLDCLSQLPDDYEFGKNKYAESFISEIERTFNIDLYQNEGLIFSDLEKIHNINGSPLKNEFNLGLITDQAKWASIFSQITRNNRGYYLASPKHAIGLFVKDGKYVI